MKEHRDKVWGTHSYFYYYGTDHLLINMYSFAAEGIAKNEAVHVSMEYHLYEKLLTLLRKRGVCTEWVSFVPAKELILAHKEAGLFGLKQRIQNAALTARDSGNKGVRWILQSALAIRETAKQDFLDMENDLSKALKGTDAALICAYDFFDYLNHQSVIDQELIDASAKTHSHRLYCNKHIKL